MQTGNVQGLRRLFNRERDLYDLTEVAISTWQYMITTLMSHERIERLVSSESAHNVCRVCRDIRIKLEGRYIELAAINLRMSKLRENVGVEQARRSDEFGSIEKDKQVRRLINHSQR